MMKKALIALLFTIAAYPAHAANNYDWFWWMYETSSVPEHQYWTIRPFYYTSTIHEKTYSASIPPVIYWGYDEKRSHERKFLFGLLGDVDYFHSNGTGDYDGIYPPVMMGSSVEKKDKYFFLWPIGGTIKGKLGVDYISPWVFPGVSLFFLYPVSISVFPLSVPLIVAGYVVASMIPLYVQYGWKEYHAWGILWPLITVGDGGGIKTRRFLPFYSHISKKGDYDRYSILLLYNYSEEYTRKKTVYTRFFFPFYGHKWASDNTLESHTVLWPFFSWGYNKNTGEVSYNLPWPLFMYSKSKKPDLYKFILFPFYGTYRYEGQSFKFITPLYMNLKRQDVNFSSDYDVFCLIYWKFHREYPLRENYYYGKKWDFYKLWPIFNYERNDRGDVRFNLLSLLFFRDPQWYERIYSPLWSVVEYSRFNGEKTFGLFMRTYYQRERDDYFIAKIPILYTYVSYRERMKELSFVLSMFGYRENWSGRYLRLLWIPVRVGDEKLEPLECRIMEPLIDDTTY